MGEIRIVTAGAGTGKTHRLAEELRAALTDPIAPVAPESVVAVTFTRAAAAELEERVRRSLLAAGHAGLAHRLAAARIGTVHSVCARLIQEYAFDLGISPEVVTIDERVATTAFAHALSDVVSADELAVLDDLERRLRGFSWHADAKRLVDAARENAFDEAALRASGIRSVELLRQVLPPALTAAEVEEPLLRSIDDVRAKSPVRDNAADAVREEHAALNAMRETLLRGEHPPWQMWRRLEESRWKALQAPARAHVRHPQFHADLCQAVELVHDIACRALLRYADDKLAWGVLDFVDQESFACGLLADPSLRSRLEEQVELVLVDEFQDTSPIQLAVFVALSQVARRTVLVGDEKQAIYGFRGTDPALLSAVVKALASDNVDQLAVSRRSRAALVRATSAVFARAFERRGISPERVVLQPLQEETEPGLGAHVERWQHDREERDDADVIAAGIAEILTTRDVLVRAKKPGSVVPATARDIAVLARTNRQARAIASAMARRGVPVVLRRSGLSSTLEARIVLAALSLWLDPRDRLAAAELSRVLCFAEAPASFIQHLLADDGEEGLLETEPVRAVVAAARARPMAGVVGAIDAIVDALALRRVLPGLGDGPTRMADLSALRALAVRFVAECAAQGAGATIGGFIGRLDELAARPEREEDPDDDRGDLAGHDAVEVLTWHKAKGREWPIVVLANLFHELPPRPFGVFAERTIELPSLQRPLEGRWLRYWPNPYALEGKGKNGLFDELKQTPLMLRLIDDDAREQLRLLYVGFTRARDRIIVVGAHDVWERGIMKQLVVDGRTLCCDPPGGTGRARWAGADIDVEVRTPPASARMPPRADGRTVFAEPLARPEWPPAFIQPSAADAVGTVVQTFALGTPLLVTAVKTNDDMNRLGRCVHAFFAVDRSHSDLNHRLRMAGELLVRFEAAAHFGAHDLVEAADRLWRFIDATWPGCRLRREEPLLRRLPGRSVVRGQIDLLVEHDAGFAIIDHKTTLDTNATGYAGQLRAYAEGVVEATRKTVTDTLIHFPVSGIVVGIR